MNRRSRFATPPRPPDSAAGADRPVERIGPPRAVATFDAERPGWFVDFPDGLPGLATPFLDTWAWKGYARNAARKLVASAYGIVGDPFGIPVEIEWRNESAYRVWFSRQRAAFEKIGTHRVIAMFMIGEDSSLESVPFWYLHFPGTVGDPSYMKATDGVWNTPPRKSTKADALRSAQEFVAIHYDFEADESSIPVEIEWRNEELYRRWLSAHAARRRRREAHLREIGTHRAVAFFENNRRDGEVWRVEFPDGLAGFERPVGYSTSYSGISPQMKSAVQTAQGLVATAYGFEGPESEIRVRMEWRNLEAYRSWASDLRPRPLGLPLGVDDEAFVAAFGVRRAFGTYIGNRGLCGLWKIELPDSPSGAPAPFTYLCPAEPWQHDLENKAQTLLEAVHDFPDNCKAPRVNATWRNEAECEAHEDLLDAAAKNLPPQRAVATFAQDPDLGALWRLGFPDGLPGLSEPVEICEETCGYQTLVRDPAERREGADEDARKAAVDAAQRLVAFARNLNSYTAEIRVEMEWRTGPAYRAWLDAAAADRAIARAGRDAPTPADDDQPFEPAEPSP